MIHKAVNYAARLALLGLVVVGGVAAIIGSGGGGGGGGERVYQTPEVRPDKVARLKEAVDRGTYEIDAAKLADILIEESDLKR